MSSISLRVVAAGVSFVVAVVIGVLAGIAGGFTVADCQSVTPAGPAASQPATGDPAQKEKEQQKRKEQGGTPGTQPGNQNPPNDQDGNGNFNQNQPNNGGGQQGQPRQFEQPGHTQNNQQPLAAGALTAECEGGGFGFSVPAALVAFFGTFVSGLLVLLLLVLGQRRGRPSRAATTVLPVSAPPVDGGTPDRDQLIQTLIYVRDRASSNALADRIVRDLHAIGVVEIRPENEVFDPSKHEAGGSQETTDPQQQGRIAGVETPGYLDRGRVLRLPVVTVYRKPVT